MKERNRKKDKSLIALALVLVAIMAVTLCACSKNGSSKDNQVTSSTPVVEDSTESTEEVKQSEETIVESTEDVVEPTEVVESTEETTPDESKVEMVDFETWAKQEDNDEVCLVVWNEELGVQEIMPTFQETEEIYQVQEGDRFAIPYRESIIYIGINDDSQMWDNTEYFELSFEGEKATQITIIFENKNGEDENKNYFFK